MPVLGPFERLFIVRGAPSYTALVEIELRIEEIDLMARPFGVVGGDMEVDTFDPLARRPFLVL